jgi:hypothetical protein
MCVVLIDGHKCISPSYTLFWQNDLDVLEHIGRQISLLAGVEITPINWVIAEPLSVSNWCRFYARFHSEESATEFMLKWQ